MNKFVVRRQYSDTCSNWCEHDSAKEKAQAVADEHNIQTGVYELTSTFLPQPKMVTKDIDEALKEMKQRGSVYTYGILNELKKQGVKSLEWPTQ